MAGKYFNTDITIDGKVKANQFIKTGGVGNKVLLDDGSTTQINQPNGVAGLDANGQVPSNKIDDRLENKILMMTGEFYDRFISGFRDRNLLIDACYNASQFDIDIVGNGSMNLGLEDTKKILTNSESNFVYFNNVDSSSQVVITIVYPTLFNYFSSGTSWQCIIENRLINYKSFRDIKVETIGTEGVWNECYNVQNVQNIRGTGMYSFPVGDYNFSKNYPQFPYGIKGIRVTLSNPNSNIVYLSNIIFRHLGNTLAPQFPHIGQNNKFYETNEFKKPLIIPNGISSNHAITLAQLNGYVSISALNVQLDNYVTKNGSVTINGTKTFTESPVIPTPTINTHAVNKSYVDVQLGSYMPTTHVANSITPTNIVNWNTAYGWGNHASAGYAMANHTHSWNEIENKPLTFVPTSHTHAISEVTGLSPELNKKSEKNTDEEWNSKKYLSNPFPLIFNDPTENTRRFGFHKPNNISSVILVPSTEPDSDNWDWANQIEFKENGKIKNKGYEIAGYDDNYVLTAGGNQAHKRDLLWTKKDSYGADGSVTTLTPKGLLTTVHIMDDTSIYTRFVLPRSATNGQKILFINDSPAAWVEVFDSTETIGAKAYNSENLEFTFISGLDGEGVLSGNGNWHAFSPTDGKIKL